MCAHVLLPSIVSVSLNEFNKFNNRGARMQDSTCIYHMTLKLHFVSEFCNKTSQFRQIRKFDVFINVNA